jgi:Peptidase A4 family
LRDGVHSQRCARRDLAVFTLPRAAGVAVLAVALIAGTAAAALPHARQRAGPAAVRHQHRPKRDGGSGERWPGQPVAWPGAVPRAVAGPASRNGTVESLNWSGYAVDRPHTTFLDVQATFFVPYLDCRVSPGTFSSDWVGLDGFVGKHPQSVQQVGIEADCKGGKGRYFAWYEMFPRPEQRRAVSVQPGDAITVAVSYNPATKMFKLKLADDTTGAGFAVRRACQRKVSCPRNSAEVISESPAKGSDGGLALQPLADYGAVSFAELSITDGHGQRGGLVSRHWGLFQITEVSASSSSDVLARPTPSQNSRFDNYWSRED